ncbi:MAG: amidophosphoribosyltransferase [Armatimonadota bacterium]|nr:MAG: amidophosphoribosyltransferase [Armatimonadota bacterium]
MTGHIAAEVAREACGVFGVFSPGEDVARMMYFGLVQLQHRGEESAGIAVSTCPQQHQRNGGKIRLHRDMGLVMQVFDENILALLGGDVAIGHNRYSTMGGSHISNAQPITVAVPGFGANLALGHNGSLVNAPELRERLLAAGMHFESTTDSEIIAKLIALEANSAPALEDAIRAAASACRGSYSLTMLTDQGHLMALRDPHGVRPLCIGEIEPGRYAVASESCALPVIGARFVREIERGELIVVDRGGLRAIQLLEQQRMALCVFEFIYFARPDSVIAGVLLHQARRRMGHELAAEHPADADLVIPVPETGWPAAIGYAEASGIPLGQGLIRNRYIGRTFIQPDQRMRDLGAQMKYTALTQEVAGKRLVVIDDTIIRGTTKAKTVGLLREAGATEVHVRITAPPYRYPCFYGVDTSRQGELIAARASCIDDIRKSIGADSLGYLGADGLVRAVGLPREALCMACLDGEYPIAVADELTAQKTALEQ